jgi:predicted dinucleotide-binding enzyme
MKIGIIGSGMIGGTLTRRFAALGHDVTVANSRGPQTLADLAAETGAAAGTVEQAIDGADVVVLAVPLRAVPGLPLDGLAGRILVDTDNYYPGRDGVLDDIEQQKVTSSRWTASYAPGAHVVKVFNTIGFRNLLEDGRPAGDPSRIALPVAADDEAAKETVFALVDALGFDPVDAGSLDESWRQEPGTAVYGANLGAVAAREALAAQTR